jgi:hypothetical protein
VRTPIDRIDRDAQSAKFLSVEIAEIRSWRITLAESESFPSLNWEMVKRATMRQKNLGNLENFWRNF